MPNVALDTIPVVYNNNGAIKYNFYNGIAGISYNVLNLPDQIRFMNGHSIQYSYDASGTKIYAIYNTVRSNVDIPLGTTDYTPNSSDVVSTIATYYCSNGHIVYEGNPLKLKRILNSEGYVEKQSDGTNKYCFYTKDHLGNNRSVFSATPTMFTGPQQEMNYYPFGMPYTVVYPPYDGLSPEFQPYKFGGKEYDEMFGLNWSDFGARFYSGVVPGFMTMDPLCEKYYSISPYVYCANNPVKYIDPTGEEVWLTMYGNDGKVSERILYTQGMEYKGKNEFFQKAVSILNKMNSVDAGSKVLQSLTSSDNQYFYTNVTPKAGLDATTVPMPNGDTYFTMTANPSLSNTAHELFHGYQIENGVGGQSVVNEVEANAFEYSILYNYANTNPSDPESQAFFNSFTNSMGKNTFEGNLYNNAFQNIISNNLDNAKIGYLITPLWFKTGSRANSTGVYNNYPFQRPNRNPGLLRSFFPLTK